EGYINDRRIKDEFARANPVRLSLQLGHIEDNLRLLLLEPVQIAWRFLARRVDRITLIDGSHGNAVVVLGADMYGRIARVGQWHFEGSDRLTLPGPWDLSRAGVNFLCAAKAKGVDTEKRQQRHSHELRPYVSHSNPPG